jgi:hypothetical protein
MKLKKPKLWIQKAVDPDKKGALRKSLGVKAGETIPESKLEKAEKSKNPTLKKRAVLAQTLKGLRKK